MTPEPSEHADEPGVSPERTLIVPVRPAPPHDVAADRVAALLGDDPAAEAVAFVTMQDGAAVPIGAVEPVGSVDLADLVDLGAEPVAMAAVAPSGRRVLRASTSPVIDAVKLVDGARIVATIDRAELRQLGLPVVADRSVVAAAVKEHRGRSLQVPDDLLSFAPAMSLSAERR